MHQLTHVQSDLFVYSYALFEYITSVNLRQKYQKNSFLGPNFVMTDIVTILISDIKITLQNRPCVSVCLLKNFDIFCDLKLKDRNELTYVSTELVLNMFRNNKCLNKKRVRLHKIF